MASWSRPCVPTAAAICAKPMRPVAPYTSADPKSSAAEPNEPTIRYFRPASSEPSRSYSIAHMTYNAIENHSSARNITIRLAEPTKNAMPAAEASRSEKNSAMCSSVRRVTCSAPTSVVARPMPQSTICASAVQRSR